MDIRASLFWKGSCILVTQHTGTRRRPLFLGILLFISLLLAQALVGCGPVSQGQTGSAPETPTAASHQAVQTPGQQMTATPTSVPGVGPTAQTTPAPQSTVPPLVLHGPTNFVLNMPFTFSSVNGVTTDDNGTTTSLNPTIIKTDVTQELHHLLFVVDSSNNVKVYSQGASPVSAQLLYNDDGTVNISYTQNADSDAGSVTILFSGVLSNKQIAVGYEQQYTPSILINAQASDIEVSLDTTVKWVAPNEIPAAPTNGAYQLTSQGGVALAWSAGQNATAYDVYRQISDLDQQFQLLATIKGTTYSDNSSEAIQNIHATKGITYAIFSVGPTGVENPGGIILSV